MNRKSLFGRFAAPLNVKCTAERPDYFRATFEPLEDRKMLSVTEIFVNDTWTDATHPNGPLAVGDVVLNNLPGADTTNHGTQSGIYGTTAFGTVYISNGDPITPTFTPTTAGGFGPIRSAMDPTFVTTSGTISILEGTYTESDIVVNIPVQIIGNGMTGAAQTLIIPEVASAEGGAANANFGVGTHSGIILFSYSSTVTNLHLDGNGNAAINTAAGHDHNFHHGVTTLYDLQGGGNYASQHNGNLTPFQINIPGGPAGNRSVPGLLVDTVTADNTYWHGLTLSALANQSFGSTNGSTGPRINISNSRVNNVGLAGGQDANRIGILLQNMDNSPTPGNASFDIVNNAGVGIQLDAFGANKILGSAGTARNKGSVTENVVNNAVLRGIDLEFWDSTGNSSSNVINNVAGANSAVGIYFNHGNILMTTNTVNGSLIGLQVQNTSHNIDVAAGITPFPTFAASFVLNGPGTGIPGSIGVLGQNSSAEPNATSFGMSFEMFDHGYETGVKLNQAVATPNGEQTLLIIDGLHVDGNKTGFNIGNNVLVQGSWFSNDPVVITGNSTYDPGFTPLGSYALAVPLSNGHQKQRIQISAHSGPTGGTFTLTYNGQTTAGIPWNAVSAAVASALNALSTITADGGVTVTGGGGATTNNWEVSINGPGPNFFPLVGNVSGITGGVGTLYTDLDYIQNSPPNGGVPNTLPRINPPHIPITVQDPPNAGVMGSGGLTLASTTHYQAQLTETAGTLPFQDFNSSINWLDVTQYSSVEVNPWRSGFVPTGMVGTWIGGATQDGTGSLIIDPTVANDLGLIYATNGTPIDISGYDTLQVVAKTRPGNTSDLILAIFADVDGTSYLYPLPMRLLNTSTYSTLTVNVNSPAVPGNDPDGVFNFSKINAWGFIGDGGFTHGGVSGQVNVGFQVDRMEFTRPNGNDQLQATSVNLAGATLDPSLTYNSLGATIIPTVGRVFKIVDNTGAGPVTGTFAGLPQGATTSVGGHSFTISYTGGTGNDVILTRINDVTSALISGSRRLFYADSAYDGYSGIPAIAHDEAIAPDKVALLPGGGESTFANVSGYVNGINGIMFDLTPLAAHTNLKVNALSDFTFKVSGPFASNSPSTWTTLSGANLPSVLVRPAGSTTIGGTLANDRIELLWPDQKVMGTWLEVIVKAGTDSGLLANDVFYFGSSPGDTGFGNDPDASFVDATDEISERNNQESDLSLAHPYNTAKSNVYDVNKDDQVDATDQIFTRNFGNTNGELDYVSISSGGPFAPATGGAGAAVASSMSTTTTSSSGSGGSWVANRLDSLATSSASTASVFGQLTAEDESSHASSHADPGDHASEVSDELLDALVT